MTNNNRSHNVGIIGDQFMLPSVFEQALRDQVSVPLEVTSMTLAWPGQPVIGAGQAPGMHGVKEFVGDPVEVQAFLEGKDIVVTHIAPVTRKMIEELPRLKIVGISRGGPTNIDIEACRERGVSVINTPGRNATAVAEFTIGILLTQTRLMTDGHSKLTRGVWDGHLWRSDKAGRELGSQTVGIIGYGNIGTRVVEHLRSFGCKMLVCDPYVTLKDSHKSAGVEQTDFHDLLKRSDIVSLHPRVTPETTGMINAENISLMKDGAYLVNTARGPLVDYNALQAALESGKLRGVALDTFESEPPDPDYPLLKLPNVTLTPHIAGASVDTVEIGAKMVASDIDNLLNGRPAENLVV